MSTIRWVDILISSSGVSVGVVIFLIGFYWMDEKMIELTLIGMLFGFCWSMSLILKNRLDKS